MYFQYLLFICILLCIIKITVASETQYASLSGIRRLNKGNYRLPLLLVMMCMVILRTFVDQNSVSDISNYQRAIYEASSTPFQKLFSENDGIRIEPGYRLLMKVFSYVSTDINLFLLIHAVISQTILYKILSKYSSNAMISIVVYTMVMFVPSVYILRQYLAILVLFSGIEAIVKRKTLKFAFLSLIAISIHYVAIVFVPVYFIFGIKNHKIYILALLSVAILLYGGFSLLYLYFGATFFGGYDTYLYTDKYNGSNYTESMIMICFTFIYCWFAKKNVLKDVYDKLFFTCIVLGCITGLAGAGLPLIGRLALYFNFVLIMLIPRTMSYIKSKMVRYGYAVIVLSLLYLAYFNDENMFTYKLIF